MKKAVRMMGAPNLIADSMEYGLSYSVISYLKKLSQQVMLRNRAIKYFEWYWPSWSIGQILVLDGSSRIVLIDYVLKPHIY